MTVTKKLIGRLPILIGEYDSTKAYSKKQRVTLYGSEFESLIDNNTYAPATLDNDNKEVTFDTEHWIVISNGTGAFLAGDKLDKFSIQENPEFVNAETDSDGKLIESTDTKGNKTVYGNLNVKGDIYSSSISKQINDTIKNKVNKEEGKVLVDKNIADSFKEEESPEYIAANVDAANKVLDSIDSHGNVTHNTKHTFKGGVSDPTNSINKSALRYVLDNSSELSKALKEHGFLGVLDWSDSDFVELPIPTVAAKINLIVDHLATAKGQDIKGYMQFWDKSGNYFKKPIVLNAQGASSIQWWIKNQAIDIDDGSTIKFGKWRPFDSFHLKKFYIDAFRGQCIVGYWLYEEVIKTRPFGKRRPYDYYNSNNSSTNGSGTFIQDFESGALCHPDGFPAMVYLNGKLQGLYVFCIKKDRDNYQMSKKNHLNIHLDGIISIYGETDYTQFEVRNPKINKDINGNKYDGDNPTEPSDDFKDTKDAIKRLMNAPFNINTKEKFESYFNVPLYIDYILFSNVIWNEDGFWKNWQYITYDGNKWFIMPYDLDCIFGSGPTGMMIPAGEKISAAESNRYDWTNTNTTLGLGDNSVVGKQLRTLYWDDIKARYKELREKGIFETNHIVGLLERWIDICGYDNLKTDLEDCCAYNGVPQTPSYRDGTKTYEKKPTTGGFYNSIPRVKKWLDEHFEYIDGIFEYTTTANK